MKNITLGFLLFICVFAKSQSQSQNDIKNIETQLIEQKALLAVDSSAALLNPFLRADLAKKHGESKKITISAKLNTNLKDARFSKLDLKQKFSGNVEITGSSKDLLDAINTGQISQIIYDPRVGQQMNNMVLQHLNADLVHAGDGVVKSTGKGVIMGIIDTGIELEHPDFKDSLGNSRLIAYWNQDDASNPSKKPSKFGYGSEWTAQEINAGLAVVTTSQASHGSHVTGIAAGNGLASGTHKGVAPDANIAFVQWYTKGGRDWKSTVADGVQYIFDLADSLNQPAVVNISLGAYWGSHDGLDQAALRIDSMLATKAGRAVVCAAGNSGSVYDYHVRHKVTGDTAFTWFEFMENSGYDFNLNGSADSGIFFEAWSDTSDYNNLSFSIGADDLTGNGNYRGSTAFRTFNQGWNIDTLFGSTGNILGIAQTYLQLIGSRYWMVVGLSEPDSSQYHYRLTTAGSGQLDIWSYPSFTRSSMVLNSHPVMNNANYYGISNLVIADSLSKIVDSWACSPNVVTVGNYVNRSVYIDHSGSTITHPETVGEIFASSSAGPTRDDRIKPDVSAPGTRVFSAGTLYELGADTIQNPWAISPDGFHKINTGTSMASPAVAGIAALFFEKCPNATSASFMDVLKSSARIDSLTGNVPNVHYGHGKADAFELLNAAIPEPILTAGDTSICKDILISTLGTYNSYTWSNGSLNSFITASNDGYYFTRVDSLGCLGYSDSIFISVEPNILPPSTIIALDPIVFCQGGSCELQADGGFAGYFWNNGLNNSQNVFAAATGFYYYYAEDNLGCRSLSDTILIVSNTSPPKPNIINLNSNLESDVIANSYNWYIDGILISNSDTSSISPAQNGYYQVEVIHANGCSTISDSLLYNSTGIKLIQESGLAIYPNPSVSGIFKLNLENGNLNWIAIRNGMGQKIIERKNINSNQYNLDLSNYSSGVYFLQIDNSSVRSNIKLIIP